MATTLQNNLLEFYFSSQLPDFRWQTDEEALTVCLYCPTDGVYILELTLTAVGGYVDMLEVRDAVDFVDFYTIYLGYEIEFLLTPGTEGLSEAQIQMCIDFLSNLDFVEAK